MTKCFCFSERIYPQYSVTFGLPSPFILHWGKLADPNLPYLILKACFVRNTRNAKIVLYETNQKQNQYKE